MEIVGGQALIEGIAIRSTQWCVAAVRRVTGEITIATGRARPSRLRSVPLLRGAVLWLVDLPIENEWAASKFEEDMVKAETDAAILPMQREDLPEPRTRNAARVITTMVLLQAVPQLVTYLGLLALNIDLAPSSARFQGGMTVTAIAAGSLYLLIIRRLPELHAVLQYASAFKMVLWSATAGEEATPAALRRYPSWHIYGSTIGFVLFAVFLSLFAVGIFANLPPIGDGLASHVTVCGVRVLLLPVVIGIVDELQRGLARLGHGGVVRLALAPLIVFDRLVTTSPTDAQIEVGAVALHELQRLHEHNSPSQPSVGAVSGAR